LGKLVLTAVRSSPIQINEGEAELKHSGNTLPIYGVIVFYFAAQKKEEHLRKAAFWHQTW
jgi:hypothetical protein